MGGTHHRSYDGRDGALRDPGPAERQDDDVSGGVPAERAPTWLSVNPGPRPTFTAGPTAHWLWIALRALRGLYLSNYLNK